ncbi:hypothetical protein QBC35DRAFT_535808 [Podospora australis]|uniref:chitinase n=1 Tax=Podospora australis TaxID=1536484 RepID=A0AAN6WN49_9PEZI|nr:hypothetical protein QBC35DRAFT_535808 [Podospora australis]
MAPTSAWSLRTLTLILLQALFGLFVSASHTPHAHRLRSIFPIGNTTSTNVTTYANNTAPSLNTTRTTTTSTFRGSRVLAAAEPKVTVCSGGQRCTLGCCSKGGNCGFGPDFCDAKNCNAALSANGSCAQIAECDAGGYPGYGALWGSKYAAREICPLNVCCSKFGFCGTTSDFCGSTTWPKPSCGGSSATARTIGYYEGWNQDRPCDHMTPEEIPVEAYTHLNFAFAYIDPNTYAVTPMSQNQTDLYLRFTGLKSKKPGLQTWIAIGGWAMNDPGPYQKVFSTLAASSSAQSAFFSSLLAFLKRYNFDGVDLDWEYPGADDRGGTPADFKNFVSFLQNMSNALGTYGISITLPASYWYLQHFDIVNLDKHVDFLNIMTYDVYGTWDKVIDETGPYVYAHTNMTVIDKGLQLLWHNNINPSRVNLGLGFYGRSYTLTNPSCKSPGCQFETGGQAGRCTGTSGVLSYSEIEALIRDTSKNVQVSLDSKEMVKIATWGGNQWAGFDDSQTLKMKLDYANKLCMGGTMIWAVDLDTTYTLAGAVSGKNVSNISPGGNAIYPDGTIWNKSPPEVVCAPPCTFFLPPSPLATPISVTWPPFQTEVLSSKSGTTYTSYTTISLKPFVISSVSLWPVTVSSIDTNVVTFTPVQSVMPPSTVLTFPGSITLFPPTPITAVPGQNTGGICPTTTPGAPVATPTPITGNMPKGCTKFHKVESGESCWSIQQKYGLSAAQFEALNPDVGAGCSSGVWLGYYYCISKDTAQPSGECGGNKYTFTGGVVSPKFFTTSHRVTIQPQATISVSTPKPPPNLRYSTTKKSGPLPTWESTKPGCKGCGDWDCGLFGCPPGISPPKDGGGGGCGLFGCDGGCGILGCGGLCGFFGCGCKGCIIKGGGGGGGGGGGPGDPGQCETPKPIKDCTVYVNIFTPTGATTKTTTSKTLCGTATKCTGQDSTTTTTDTKSAKTETMTFSRVDEMPLPADTQKVLAISSRLEARATIWNKIFMSPMGPKPTTTTVKTVKSLCSQTTTTGVDKTYTYCECGESYSSTLPLIPSTTNPCGYTELPRICRHGASPRSSREWCNCEGYPRTLPVLTTSGNQCGYTSFPAPWPYTSTDSEGNVLACETSKVTNGKTSCSGDQYTATRAPKPTPTARCIVGHTNMDNCLIDGDTMAVQVWDNGKLACRDAKHGYFKSDNSVFNFECDHNGNSVMVTDNGAKLVYKAADGWEAELTRLDGAKDTYDCAYLDSTGGGKTIKGWRFEYTFENGQCGKCNVPKLCDFNSWCDKFDPKCS